MNGNDYLPGFVDEVQRPDMASLPLTVAYGGGKNSKAMLALFAEKGIRPVFIQFADTGGELPETYEDVAKMDEWVQREWGIRIDVVRKLYQGSFEGLEGNCIRKRCLPGLAYGKKSCSMKYKIEPQERGLRKWMDRSGLKVVKHAIGYHAGETHRRHDIKANNLRKGRVSWSWYPLMEWGIDEAACREIIRRHWGAVVIKSACWFCPARKRAEILELIETRPDLFQRALEMESNAVLTSEGRGLGGKKMRWADLDPKRGSESDVWKIAEYLDNVDPLADGDGIPCGCWDG